MVPFFVFFMLTGVGGAANKWIALIIFCVASLTDMLDGKIARARNLVTNFGKIMDPLADKILVYSAFCLLIPDYVPGWMLIIILAREFTVAGMRTVAASEGIVIAAGMSGKIKTVLQMIAVPMLLLLPALSGISAHMIYTVYYYVTYAFLWASLVMTVYSGAEYVIKNKEVFRQ